jgi:hypothetical protein
MDLASREVLPLHSHRKKEAAGPLSSDPPLYASLRDLFF